jgi:hypothetical protein
MRSPRMLIQLSIMAEYDVLVTGDFKTYMLTLTCDTVECRPDGVEP